VGLCVGHSLAYYDLVIFSVLAVQISKAIFPDGDPTIGLMKTLALLGVAYLSRPLLLGSRLLRHAIQREKADWALQRPVERQVLLHQHAAR
jgi:hypothetical protein